MLRLRIYIALRLLPVLGPLLIERDLLRVRALAAELEADVLRAQLARAAQPTLAPPRLL